MKKCDVFFFNIWNEMELRDIFLIQKLLFFVNLKKPFLTLCKTRKKVVILSCIVFVTFFPPKCMCSYSFLWFLG